MLKCSPLDHWKAPMPRLLVVVSVFFLALDSSNAFSTSRSHIQNFLLTSKSPVHQMLQPNTRHLLALPSSRLRMMAQLEAAMVPEDDDSDFEEGMAPSQNPKEIAQRPNEPQQENSMPTSLPERPKKLPPPSGPLAKIVAALLAFRAVLGRAGRRAMFWRDPAAAAAASAMARRPLSEKDARRRRALRRVGAAAAALLLVTGLRIVTRGAAGKRLPPLEVGYSDFMELAAAGRVRGVAVSPTTGALTYELLRAAAGGGKAAEGAAGAAAAAAEAGGGAVLRAVTRPVKIEPSLALHLQKHKVAYWARPDSSAVGRTMLALLPLFWITGLMLYQMRSMQGKGGGGVGKRVDRAAARAGDGVDRTLTFESVQGCAAAKFEIQEIVTILRNPAVYIKAGVRLPSGVVMVGPPGTGKTLLASVMAAEAGVPFFSCSGSEFVEMFVGRGAARVRAIFERARKAAPCIIFFDEIDVLGRARSTLAGLGQSQEADQTLNQLLACMDGLDTSNNGVVVVAATNRYEVLDEALTRPGRFDRVVRVPLPDRQGRQDILAVHCQKLTLDEDVDLERVAELTPGMNGAELANLANEAAIRAVRRQSTQVTAADFSEAIKDYYSSRGSKTVQRILSDGFKIL